jgi:hypothetical protein
MGSGGWGKRGKTLIVALGMRGWMLKAHKARCGRGSCRRSTPPSPSLGAR